jgi:ABC-type antimicrobial peptide transport system permease subunit
MLKHYLKIAFRNLWKYKKQTLVSVLGLAVGFACFAVAALWIRYEMTYDGFHRNADRMYCVSIPSGFTPNGVSRGGPYPLAGYLKATFPEIARSTTLLQHPSSPEIEGVVHNVDMMEIDSSFFGMFDVKVVEGSMNFLIPKSKNLAITREKARRLFGNESPLGKTVKLHGDEHTICAVVTGLPKRSNYPFDILRPLSARMSWNVSSGEHTLVELVPGVDTKALGKKLYEHETKQGNAVITKITLTPLTSVRYEDTNIERDVKFQHIIIFAVAGSLLVLCTLINYLTLFVSRFRMRQREFALRIAFGSSNRSLLALLSTEFLISLVISLALGLFFIYMIIPPFRELSGVRLELSLIYTESLTYISVIIMISLLAFTLILAVFRRRTLNTVMRRNNSKPFRRISIVFQLAVSIGFSFCTIVILKQMYHLHNTDLGFEFKNRGSVALHGDKIDMTALEDKIRKIPEITEIVVGLSPLIPQLWRMSSMVSGWDDKPENAESINIESIYVSERFLKYYGIKLVEGELPNDTDDSKIVMINESAMKAFGWRSAVGKSFGSQTVKGVIKNIYSMSPTVPAQPCNYIIDGRKYNFDASILFKYNEGAWKTCRKKIEEIINGEYANMHPSINNAEEEYDKLLKSEDTLLRILTVVSLVCVIVCVFGFVSMVSLTCEERRKEIAIRKINGATIKDILDIFFKEYLTLLAVGTLIAFPVGYIIMKRWLESYVVQTEISAWIYLSILLALIMAIVLCVGGKVYTTSRENPINAIK